MNKNYGIRVCLLFFFSLCILCSTYSQKNPLAEVSIASPNAASLAKYVDFPVSYNTGTPQINIPIYSVQSGSIELPVSLSYHASGLKVQELASWVGAGWSLNAGGVITRSIAGSADDKGFPVGTNQTAKGHWTDYGYNSYLSNGTSNAALIDDDGISKGIKDGEPDMYFFNFGKYSGKFFFRDDRTPVLVSQQDIKIEPDYNFFATPYQSGTCFQGFTITTPDGTHYYFGNTQNVGTTIPVEVASPYTLDNGFSNGAAVSSWYLNKIVSKDNQFSIVLKYQQDNYSYYTLSMFPLYSNNLINQYEYKPIKQFIQGVRLSSIEYSGGQIVFNPSTSPRSDLSSYSSQTMSETANIDVKPLGSIQISNNNGYSKLFNFTYGYFHDAVNGLNGQLSTLLSAYNIQSDTYRLRLDTIQESSTDGTASTPPYQFSYFSETVPRLLSFGIDHWGYYNGITSNSTLIPAYTKNGTTVSGADRDAHWPAMRGGTLNQITYPTGGYTAFDFESHSTYKSYYTNVQTSRASVSVLYDGSTYATSSFTTSGSSNAFTITINSTGLGIGGYIQIYSSTGTYIGTYYAQEGTTATYQISLSPSTTYNLQFYGTKTTANWGGCTGTIYEMVSTLTANNVTVGGLRIKTMTHHEPLVSTDIITSYNYTPAGSTQSSGVLYSLPVYVSILRNDSYGLIWPSFGSSAGCASLVGGGVEAIYLVSPNSVKPMQVSQGNHIGYNEVSVSQTGRGKTIYRYYGFGYWDSKQTYPDVAVRTVNTQTCDASVASYPYAPVALDFMNGELKYEGYFNQSGQILKDVWHYPIYLQDNIGTPGLIVKNLNTNYGTSGGPLFGTEYNLYSAGKTQDKSVETNYNPATGNSNTVTNTVYYESLFHHQPTRKEVDNSKGDILKTSMRYSFDFRIANCDALSNGLQTYNSSISSADGSFYSQVYSCTPVTGGIDNCRYNLWGQYRIAKLQARISLINTLNTNFNNSNSLFKNNFAAAKSVADAELKPILQLEDAYENALIETSNWKNSQLISANFTRHDFIASPAGYVFPQKTQTLNLSSPSSSFVNAATNNVNYTLLKDSRYTDEVSYIFENGNLVSLTKKDGIVNSYLWGYNNLYPVAKIAGADYYTAKSIVNLAILQAPASDAQLRSELSKLPTNLPNALVTGYTYSPMLGITSQIDPQGRINYFEYEPLGRLKRIKNQDGNIVKQLDYQYHIPITAAIPMSSIICSSAVGAPFILQLSNLSTGQSYSFSFFSTGTIGQVPAGNYNVTLFATNYNSGHAFIVNGFFQSGVSVANYSNILFPASGSTVSIY
ncbi:MAG: hypothetical protein K2Q21_02505 [Chitinophagaceae bacterium]|nr:hypothetical protein [Chitinophagaceae bacterium]